MFDIEEKEQRRLDLQNVLDGMKTQVERNRLGQFATPTALARDIILHGKRLLSPQKKSIRFLDPALGTGSFYSALLHSMREVHISFAMGFEIDEEYARVASSLWHDSGLNVCVKDFTHAKPPINEVDKADFVICNPPYVRHHHISIEEKKRLHADIVISHGISLSGLSGLYCYFLCLSQAWMAKSGLAAWLIPSEFMDVNYGNAVKDFLLNKVSLVHIHRFLPQDVQFGDALVSSAIVWFKNEKADNNQCVKFSLGGSMSAPSIEIEYSIEQLRREKKWTSLPRNTKTNESNSQRGPVIGDFFDVKRGIATGANDFFILSRSEVENCKIPPEFLIPILPSPRYLMNDIIQGDQYGVPLLDRVNFLFSSDIPEENIRKEFPTVWRYLQKGRDLGISDRYLCRHRSPWYSQEKREAPPILCTYMGRTSTTSVVRPFRFILNHSKAVAANVYLMLYPKQSIRHLFFENPAVSEQVWHILQSIPLDTLIGEGRVYGGGLHKLEPRELMNAPANQLASLFPSLNKTSWSQMAFL